ncbi:MAG: hypothetical protein KKF39_00300 [Nanoarchaeota archaeon]|nr:hypothetical protein [Nanoarchaeota archaeon]
MTRVVTDRNQDKRYESVEVDGEIYLLPRGQAREIADGSKDTLTFAQKAIRVVPYVGLEVQITRDQQELDLVSTRYRSKVDSSNK